MPQSLGWRPWGHQRWAWPQGVMRVSPALRVGRSSNGTVSIWVAGGFLGCGSGVLNLEVLGDRLLQMEASKPNLGHG